MGATGDGGGGAPHGTAPARGARPHPAARFPQRAPQLGSGQGTAPGPFPLRSRRLSHPCGGARRVSDEAQWGDRDRTCSGPRERSAFRPATGIR